MSERTDFIATLQACYFGDKNAFEKVLRIYDEKQDRIDKAIEFIGNNTPNLSNAEIYDLLEILKGGNNEC